MIALLYRFDDWANDQVLAALAALDSPPPRAVRLFAHIVAARRLWLARLLREPMPNDRFPTWTLPEAAAYYEEVKPGWIRFLDGLSASDLERVETYQDTFGRTWSDPLSHILAHVATHGHYHRGQIASELAAHGHTPPATDLIVASRTGALHAPRQIPPQRDE
jgi:uncharacterized damage-inducible protein DinB